MATSARKSFDEALVDIYEQHFLSQADTVYRFALALTLSLDGAKELVRRTFQAVADDLSAYAATAETTAPEILADTCWRQFEKLGPKAASTGQTPLIKALAPLPVEARAALVTVDVAGLDPAAAAKVLRMSDKDLRQHLAHARRKLIQGSVEF